MKRLSVLLVVACVLVALLALPVCAAVIPYQFDMMASVSVLPDFEIDPVSGSMLCCAGFLPDGEYIAFIWSPSLDFHFAFEQIFDISFDVSGSESSYPVCIVEPVVHPSIGGGADCFARLFYSAEDDVTYFQLCYVDDGSALYLPSDSVLTLVRADANSDGEVSSGYLKDYVVELFGPYQQQTETITQTLADGSTVTVEQRIPGIAGLDYEWFAALCLFGLMLYCFFRLLGGVFK